MGIVYAKGREEVKDLTKMISVILTIGLMALFAFPAFASLIGDINGDGTVDLKDLVLVAKAFGSRSGSANWDPRCDINGNGGVDLTDLVAVAVHFGETSP